MLHTNTLPYARSSSIDINPYTATSTTHITTKTKKSVMGDIAYYFSPRQRLDTLFVVHAIVSVAVGTIGFLFPTSLGLVFLTETEREFNVARAIFRPTCALVLAQGLIIHQSRHIIDGAIKRAFVRAYFVCFGLSTLALVREHAANSGVVSGKFVGTMQVVFMIALTAGYGWFTFFQPPSVFQGLAMHSHKL